MTRKLAIGLALLIGAMVAATILMTEPSSPNSDFEDYQRALEDTRDHVQLAAGTPELDAAVAGFMGLFADLTETSVAAKLPELYADELFFNDTLKTIRSRAELEHYLLKTVAAVRSCRVELEDDAVSDSGVYVRWAMSIEAPRLSGGKLLRSKGMSHLRFDGDGRIILQQDFWDAAGGLYEHLPVVGWTIRKIKTRL